MTLYDRIGGEYDRYRNEIGARDLLSLVEAMGDGLHDRRGRFHAYPVNAQRFHVAAFPASKREAPHFGGPKRGRIAPRVLAFGPIVGLEARLGR